MQDSNQIEQKGEDQLQSAKLEENIFNRSHSFPQHTSTQIGLFYNAINTTQNSAIPCKGGLFEKNQVSQDPFSQSGAGGLFHNSGGLFHNQGGLFDTNPASKDSIFQSTGRSFDKNQVSQETNSQKPSQQSEQNQEADKEEHKQEITQKNNESQEKEKKQYFSKNCPSHQGYNLQFLSVDQNSKKYLLCPLCISEGNGGQYIYLDLIFGNDKLIKNLPKEEQENSEFLKQMQYVLGEQDFSNQVKQKINDKFENLKKQIISQLDIKQKEMLKQAELLENYQNKIQQNYNNYIQKDKIKELLIKDQNINQVEQKLKSIIDGIYTRQKKFQQEVQQDMINYQTQISAINYDQVSDISKRILQQISAIEVFKISDLKSLSQTDYENNMSVYNEELFKTDPNKLTASQLLVRLLSNKMNNCPPSLLEQFKQLIAKIQGFIDTQGIKIPKNNNLFKVDYNKFDDSQIKLIQDLSESLFQDSNNSSSFQPKNNNKDILMGLISNKFNQCSKEFLEYISSQLDKINPFIKSLDLDNKGYQISGSKLNQAKLEQLIELVKDLERDDKKKFNQIEEFKKVLENETNNLSVEFINNYKLVSIQYPDILENLLLKQGIFQKSKSPIMDFNRLNNHQMTNLQNLAKKMNQLKDDFDSRYLNSKQPIHYQQIQSAHFVNQIKRCLNIKTLEQQLKLEQEQEIEDQNTKQKLERALEQLDIIQQLLVKYPIFDLREDLFVHKLQLEFQQVQLTEINPLSIQKSIQNNPLLVQKKSVMALVVTKNSLNPNLNYVFRCKLNKNLNCDAIAFGIMQDINTEKEYLWKENLCFKSSRNGYGLNKIINGCNLFNVRDQVDYIEVRVNVNKKIMLFADYPHYQNINQANPENFSNNKEYKFGIQFYAPGENYEVEITDINVVQDDELETFLSKDENDFEDLTPEEEEQESENSEDFYLPPVKIYADEQKKCQEEKIDDLKEEKIDDLKEEKIDDLKEDQPLQVRPNKAKKSSRRRRIKLIF
ncbi:hypothetical protein TTHERM_00579030 (macronuclear) [Tetrahymena thermophila SB210]|uniref:Uncharacterized protein n=1 Tax=Tetrahymena thermophila (strain SB210) TaxID=312017 RepID=I7M384_TETTS|nr:hypothetical protein TTHERM_00579030 [Tetrahymena thermophila SB210]EAS02659.1 hypothetical protein TTHERM_00579030 [Tetrahymena thermophila SB210]|eukprot:XP_001022904.1 hypothetical protein TTHERM_00579030 [Tetrahymena thermophila SB210]